MQLWLIIWKLKENHKKDNLNIRQHICNDYIFMEIMVRYKSVCD